MVSARSRTRSRVRCRAFQRQKRDRRKSPSRMGCHDCSRSRSRSRSRSPSPSPSRSRCKARCSPDGDAALRSRFDRGDTPRPWRQRGRSPITLRELSSLADEEENAGGSRVLVAGLNYIVTEKDLEKKFASFAQVLDVYILKACKGGESRGLAILTLDPEGNVDEAVKALDHTHWNGRIVQVERLR